MPRNQSQSEARSAEPEFVSVFNNNNHMLGIGVRNRPAGTNGPGPVTSTIEFLPGNNRVKSSDLKRCQEHPLWSNYSEKRLHRGLTGRQHKYAILEVGRHDEDFEVEAKELGERMFQLKQKRAEQ
jgi:hypothetical protein